MLSLDSGGVRGVSALKQAPAVVRATPRHALVRRREVWLPTWRGWLLLLLVGGSVLFAVGRSVDHFLGPVDPARGPDGRGASTLVVEGWIDPPALHRAVEVFRAGHYRRVLTTGGPIESWMDKGDWGTFAARGAAALRADGRIDVPIVAVPAPASALERSYQSAVAVREWAAQHRLRLDAIDVYTLGVHARRSRVVYRLAFRRTAEIGIIADHPRLADGSEARWWSSSAHAKQTFGESLGWLWTECCFWPDPPR